MSYATIDDVYAELSAMAFVVAPRVVGAAPSSLAADFAHASGIIRLPGNGYTADDVLYAVATSGGTLPGGMLALTAYHPLPGAFGDVFRLALTANGTPLTFTSAGTGWGLVIDSARRIRKHLADTAAILDNDLTAHATPLKPDPITGLYPQVIVGVNARMAARKAVTSLQIETPQYRVAVDRLFAIEKDDNERRAEWRSGKPVLPQPTDQTSTADDRVIAGNVGGAPANWITGLI